MTFAPVQNHRAVPAGCAAALLLLAAHAGVITWVEDEAARKAASDLFTLLAAGAAGAVMAWVGWACRHVARPFVWLWLLAGAAHLLLAATLVPGLLGERPGAAPFPSPADFLYLLHYPVLAGGIWMLPSRPFGGRATLKSAIDITLTSLTVGVIFWNFLFVPLINRGGAANPLDLALTFAYPAVDLLLIMLLLVTVYRLHSYRSLNPLFLLAASVAVLIVTDSLFSFQHLPGTNAPARLLDLGYTLSSALAALAALWFYSLARAGAPPLPSRDVSRVPNTFPLILLPNLWIAAAFLILFKAHEARLPLRLQDLVFFISVVTVLVMARQWLAASEAAALQRSLQTTLQQVQAQAQELERAQNKMEAEIVERRRAEERRSHDALHDSLTGLPNRALFLDRLLHAREKSRRGSAAALNAVLFLDLDGFKVINDSLGHLAGDLLLAKVAGVLQKSVRVTDTVARIGGDEFAILLEELQHPGEWKSIVARLQREVNNPIDLDGQKVFITTSIGVVLDAHHYTQAEDVLRDADLALYEAKARGRSRHEVYRQHLHVNALWRMTVENDLRAALEGGGLFLHYQPILRLPDETLAGFEALVRWQHPTRGMVAPGEFIHIAEETGLIVPLGRQVLEMACRQAAEWRRANLTPPGWSMRVNISGVQLSQPDFASQVTAILQENDLPPECLVLEITETAALENLEWTREILLTLRDLGVRAEIDDFGTGYSSLSYIQKLPVEAIKIDRSFINNILDREDVPDLLRAIFILAGSLGIEAVAEGVETGLQLALLKELGCAYAQGFFLSPPVAAERAAECFLAPALAEGG